MAEGEDEGSARWRASVRNEVEGPAGPVVQAGSISGDVVVGADPGRRASSELDEWAEGLARAVQAFWNAEEARRQIHDPVSLPVRWQAGPARLRDHWANIRRLPAASGGGVEPLSLAGCLEQIAEVYGRIPSRRLVMLGPAGAGKTVLAGRLALEVLTARQPGEPVPVLVSLAAWNPATTSLHTWLIEQLLRDHPGLAVAADAGKTTSRAAALVTADRILPILDGFDELDPGLQEAALRRLNTHTGLPLVLTSRQDEYATAVQGADVVTAAAVVLLQELSQQDLAAYLPRTVAGSRTGIWDPVLERLRTQPHAPDSARLHRVLTNPLMVFLARTAYSDLPGRNPTELLDPVRFPTSQSLQEHLLAEFVPAAYRPDRDTGGDRTRRRWSAEQAGRYLAYLANHLHRAGTRDLAWWQLRGTIARPRRTLILATIEAVVAGLASSTAGLEQAAETGLTTMLASALTVAVTVGLATALTNPRLQRLPRILTGRATLALGTGLTIALTVVLTRELLTGFRSMPASAIWFGGAYGCVGGAAAGLVGFRTAGPQPSRTRLQIRGRTRGIAGRFTVWFAAGLAVWIMAGIVDTLDLTTSYDFVLHPKFLARGTLAGIVVGLAAVFVYGFEAPLNADEVISPAESLARDRQNSLRKTLAAGLAGGSMFEILSMSTGAGSDWAFVLITSVVTGWVFVRPTSAWLYWLVLVRGWLPLTGRLPWRVRAFLIDAHQRGVLRQTGAVYQFRHVTLQDQLTTETPTPRSPANS